MSENLGSVEFNAEEFIVHGGQRSQKIAGLKKVRGGIFQQVGANIDWDYEVSAWHNERGICKCRLGIDPNGGTNPDAPSIAWTEGSDNYDWAQLRQRVTAKSRLITVFLETQYDDNSADAYFDDAKLMAYPCPLKMPIHKLPPKIEQKCVDWTNSRRQKLGTSYETGDFKFHSSRAMQIIESGIPTGKGKLIITPNLEVKLPFETHRVTAQIVRHVKAPLHIESIGIKNQVLGRHSVASDIDLPTSVELRSSVEPIAAVRFVVEIQGDLLVSLCAFSSVPQRQPASVHETNEPSDKSTSKRTTKKMALPK
jgi:hypothetical protein